MFYDHHATALCAFAFFQLLNNMFYLSICNIEYLKIW